MISNDPNESIELREMVNVAASYFDQGMLDDAEDMLRDVLDAGYSLNDALTLNRRIQDARALASKSSLGRANGYDRASDAEITFTRPLPGIEYQPSAVRRIVEDADRDIAAGRLHSAHDATLVVLAQAPTYFPTFIRLAELRFAFGDDEGATGILETLGDVLAGNEPDDWLTLSMLAILDPGDTDIIIQLAQSLINQRGLVQLDPYVPNAVERAMREHPQAAIELAREYLQLRPNDAIAQALYIRAVAVAGDLEETAALLRREVGPDSAADLLFLRSAIAYSEGRTSWFEWLERMVARLLDHPDEYPGLTSVMDAGKQLVSGPQHGLTSALAHLAAGNPSAALDSLEPWSGIPRRDTSDKQEMLVAACARAFAMESLAPAESIHAFCSAIGQAVVIDVRPFAESSSLFAQPMSAQALMDTLVRVARDSGQQERAIDELMTLRDRLPEHLEIRSGLGQLQVSAGRVAEGLRELRYIAEKHERAGNIREMVNAMRQISAAVPNNVDLKAKLIEAYVNRGVPDEAVVELQRLGDLQLKRSRMSQAADAFRRGAEIAATTGAQRLAGSMFEQAIAAAPNDVSIRHAAVAFYIMTGAVDKANQQLWEVVRIALDAEDPDEAIAALHQVIGLSPTDAAAYHRLGEVLTSVGEYAQAERVYRRLSAITPDDPVLAAKQSALAALASGK